MRLESQNGKFEYFDRIGATAAQKVTTRHGDSPLMSTPHDRRRVSLVDYDWGDLIDNVDKLRMLIDPASPYAMNAADALGRALDDEIIAAYDGSAYSGEDGSTIVSWDTNNDVAVNFGGDNLLNIKKLIEAKRLLDKNEVPENDRYFVTNAKGMADLLNQTEVKSADYNTIRALVYGELNTFLGFNFIRSERLVLDGSGDVKNLAFQKDGVLLSMAQDITTRIEERADKRFSTYVYARMSIGSTRMEEKRCVRVMMDA